MARPTDTPNWNPPSGDVTAPSAPKRALGWLAERPSRKAFNWFWQNVSQWIAWLGQGQVYDSLPELIEDTTTGDHATVCDSTGVAAWSEVATSAPLTSGGTDGYVYSVRSNGRYAVYLLIQTAPSGAYFLRLHDLLDDSAVWGVTVPATQAMDFDGRYIYVADDDEVVVYDLEAEGGLTSATEVGRFFSHSGRAVTFIALNGPWLVTVEDNGSTGSIEGWERSSDPVDPTWTWSYSTNVGSPNDDVKDIKVGAADRVYIAKNYSGASDSLITLVASTGSLVDRLDLATNGIAVAVDGEQVYLGIDSDAVYLLDLDGGVSSTLFTVNLMDRGLAVDGDYLALVSTDLAGLIRKGTPAEMASKLFAWVPSGAHSDPLTACALDGGALLLGAWKRTGDSASVAAFRQPAKARSFRRVSPLALKPFPSLSCIPE